MLEELYVTNFGLIEESRIEPGAGLVVVTGETGTGKTMLLGALDLLTGSGVRRQRIGPHGDELSVEGRFLVDGEEAVVARRVARSGRSKAYRDGAMVTAKQLAAEIGERVEIVAQHDALSLTKPSGVLRLVDSALDESGRSTLDDYERAWHELTRLRTEHSRIGGDGGLEPEMNAARAAAAEIAEAGLVEGEHAELVTRVRRLRNAETLTAGVAAAHSAIVDDRGAADLIGDMVGELRRLVSLDASLEPLHAQASHIAELLLDLATELSREAMDIEHDPAALSVVESRIQQVNQLRSKYGDTAESVLAYARDSTERADIIEQRLEAAKAIIHDIDMAEAAAVELSEHLHLERQATAERLASSAEGHMQELGMASPVVRIEFTKTDLGPAGIDRTSIVFASDVSLQPGPVSLVASGGELSRLVLSLRLAARADGVPVLAFDEIDAGVGGATALAMGEKLARLAIDRQVLCVSHLPQIAAFADSHFVVERVGGAATVRLLAREERVAEIARMLSGLGESGSARSHAVDLIAAATQKLAG